MAVTLTVGVVLGAANAGLTLTPELRNADGTVAAGLTTTNMIEVAASSGAYEWTGTIPEDFRGYLRFLDGATFKAHVPLEPAEVQTERVVWNAATRTLTSFGTLVADVTAAVWAAGSRTLTGFGTLVADIWAYATRTLTMTARAILAAVEGDQIVQHRGDAWSIPLTDLGDLSSRAALYFTVKVRRENTDAEAILQVSEAGGLLTLNSAVYATPAHATLVVTDAAAGNLTITVAAEANALIRPGDYDCDVQQVTATGPQTVHDSPFSVNPDVSRRIT